MSTNTPNKLFDAMTTGIPEPIIEDWANSWEEWFKKIENHFSPNELTRLAEIASSSRISLFQSLAGAALAGFGESTTVEERQAELASRIKSLIPTP